MEKYIEVGLLYDFYGELLSEKQKTIVDYYYNENLSLSEIAEKIDMSRQGVYDQLRRAEESLYRYEDKLQLIKKYNHNRDLINDALGKIERAAEMSHDYKDVLLSAEMDLNRVLKQL